MKLGNKSHKKIENFFREYLADDNFLLPEIYFYTGKFTYILTSILNIGGITIGNRVFIFPESVWISETKLLRLDEELVVHEITHVLQYQREGFFKFLWFYTKWYLTNLRKQANWDVLARSEAYFKIPYEIEARKTASKFVDWSNKRNLK